jgi:hypothetical protein
MRLQSAMIEHICELNRHNYVEFVDVELIDENTIELTATFDDAEINIATFPNS